MALFSCSATHGYCIECRPIMLPSVSTMRAMWPYSPINVRVPAPILSLGSRHWQMGRDMCAKPLQQGRATDRVDGILGFACHVKEPRLEMDHRMHGVGPNDKAHRRAALARPVKRRVSHPSARILFQWDDGVRRPKAGTPPRTPGEHDCVPLHIPAATSTVDAPRPHAPS